MKKSLDRMKDMNCDEVVLETEITNSGAMRLYEKLGKIFYAWCVAVSLKGDGPVL